MVPSSALLFALVALVSVCTSTAEAQTNFFGDPGEYMVQGKPEAAARHLRLRTERGESNAMFALAHLYRTGAGVTQDLNHSTALYLRAAELGHIDAQYMAGVCYEKGRGVEKNFTTARAWFEKASHNGQTDARGHLAQLDQAVTESPAQLSELIRSGNLSAVDALLQAGANPNARDVMDTPILHLAVLHKQPEIVDYLVRSGADLRATDSNLDTALHVAAANEMTASYTLLRTAGADPNVANHAGWTPQQLLARRAPVATNAAKPGRAQRLAAYRKDPRFGGWSTLSVVAWTGDTELVRKLLANGDHLAVDSTGYSPLARAVQNGQVQAARMLLEAGANAADPAAPALAHLAVANGDTAMLQLLITQKVPLDRFDLQGTTALQRAIRTRQSDLADVLLDGGAGPGLASEDQVTPLMIAAQMGDARITSRVTRSGVDLTAMDSDGRTALHYVATSSCDPTVFEPLAAMLPLAPDAHGQWPLHLATETGCIALAKALLERGHAVDVVSTAGNTPLALAAALGVSDIVRPLLVGGADPNRRDPQGETPLHRAVRHGKTETITLLLSFEANPSIRNNNELNAFDLAEDPAILEVLRSDPKQLLAVSE
jgi:ankyrin repeat protein